MANILVIQKLTNFAQNLMDMAKSKKATNKKAVKVAAKPAAKKVVKPAPKAKVKPKAAAKPAAKKAVKKVAAKPAPKKVQAKSVPAKASKAAPKKAAKVAPKKVVKPAPKKVVKAAPKKAAKPAPKKVVKVAPKKAVKKAAPKKVAPKKAVKPAAKPIVKKVTPKKIEKPASKKVAAPAKKAAPAKVAPKPAVVAKAQPKPIQKPVAKVEAPKVEVKAAQPATENIQIKKPLFKKPGNKKNSKPVETYDGKRVVRSELPAKALITIQKPEEEVTMEHTHYEYPTLRYSDAELKEFKLIIDKKLEAAREELRNLKDSLDSHTESQVGNKSWNMEEGSDTSEMEYLMNQIARLNKFIRDLEMALVRIENKTYGICRATGKLIDKQRLRIVPHATLSMEAKMSRKSDDIPNISQAPSAHMGSEGEGFGGEE